MELQLSEWDILRLIKTGILNGRFEAVVRLIDDALVQEPKKDEAAKGPSTEDASAL